MLRLHDTARAPSFHPGTSTGPPFDVGLGQQLGRWLLRLVLLPEDQAKPWPKWIERFAKPLLLSLVRQLTTRNRRRIFHLLWPALTDPPRSNRRDPFHSQRTRKPHFLPQQSFSELLDRLSVALHGAQSLTGNLIRAGVIVFAIAFLFVCAAAPLTPNEQLVLLVAMWCATLLIRKLQGAVPGLIMMAFSIIASSRYVWWRLTQSLDLDSGVEMLLGAGLIAAECYTWIVLILGYIQNARPLHRKPVALAPDRSEWPTVDVFIPTYNEPLKVVKPTVLAALNLDWPAEKLRVYILDDGKRPDFRQFAAEVGAEYITRPNNAHAKAGNLNHALRITSGQFIAIFDCDHVPVRNFLTTTMGWFDADPRCAIVQTPHHFYSPDPFERNLGTFRRVPNEGSLFHDLIQDGNDLWNAAFFCGSCAVLRRAPLEEVGGIAEETVTEDAHTALKIHRRGYTTVYLRQALAHGLATESLATHVGQRIRWARGMAQIFRLDNPLRGPGLRLPQRLCYANSMLHFFSGIPRLIFLTAPLMYLYFELHIINAAAMTLAAYAIPHMLQSMLANSRLQGRFRHSFWGEAYETVLAWYITLPTTLALINPRLGKFNVTAKGGQVERDFFDWRIATPYLVLALLNLIGAIVAIPRLLVWNVSESDTVLVNLMWTLFNLISLGVVLSVAAETRQVRAAHRVASNLPATLSTADGAILAANVKDFSMLGLGVITHLPHHVTPGEHATVTLKDGSVEHSFSTTVASANGTRVGLALNAMPIVQERNYVRCTFSSPAVWTDLAKTTNTDRPLTSFSEVLSFGVTGYLRLLESLAMGRNFRRRTERSRMRWADDHMGLWSAYFFAKFLLYAGGYIGFSPLPNLLFAIFTVLPTRSARQRFFKNLLAIPAGIALLYHDSWLPPIERVLSQTNNVASFTLPYLIELVGRFINLELVTALIAMLAAYALARRRLRMSTFAFLGIFLIILAPVGGLLPQLAAQSNVVASVGAGPSTAQMIDPRKMGREELDKRLSQFYAQERSRQIHFPSVAQSDPPYDIFILHVCSLSWDDLQAVNRSNDPLLKRFDILFTSFSSAASYSGPAAIRLLRGNCGETTHKELYDTPRRECLVINGLQDAGFEPHWLMNHDGDFGNFHADVSERGAFPAALTDSSGAIIAQRSFDGSPIYDDYSVLSRWWSQRASNPAARVVLYYNTISLHDGNRVEGRTKDSSFATRLAMLTSNIGKVLDDLQRSGRRVIVIIVPEHGAAVRGDRRQIPGLREIPTPAITRVPVGVMLVNAAKSPNHKPLQIHSPASYLALNELLSRFLRDNPFNATPLNLSAYTGKLPRTDLVAENDGTVIMQIADQYMMRTPDGEWSHWAAAPQTTPTQ